MDEFFKSKNGQMDDGWADGQTAEQAALALGFPLRLLTLRPGQPLAQLLSAMCQALCSAPGAELSRVRKEELSLVKLLLFISLDTSL
jgi:hypothetical protein